MKCEPPAVENGRGDAAGAPKATVAAPQDGKPIIDDRGTRPIEEFRARAEAVRSVAARRGPLGNSAIERNLKAKIWLSERAGVSGS